MENKNKTHTKNNTLYSLSLEKLIHRGIENVLTTSGIIICSEDHQHIDTTPTIPDGTSDY